MADVHFEKEKEESKTKPQHTRQSPDHRLQDKAPTDQTKVATYSTRPQLKCTTQTPTRLNQNKTRQNHYLKARLRNTTQKQQLIVTTDDYTHYQNDYQYNLREKQLLPWPSAGPWAFAFCLGRLPCLMHHKAISKLANI